MSMPKEYAIPCFFTDQACPKDCPLYDTNRQALENAARSFGKKNINAEALARLILDPGEIASLAAAMGRHQGYEAAETLSTDLTKFVQALKDVRAKEMRPAKPDCKLQNP
jgi:hypothetical protein